MTYTNLIILYTMVVITLHVIPTESGLALDQLTTGPIRADYLLHTLIFLPWMVLVWLHLGTKKVTGGMRTRQIFKWLAAGLILAAFSEGIQLFIPYRSFNPLDLIFNLSGVLLGSLIFLRKNAIYPTKIRA